MAISNDRLTEALKKMNAQFEKDTLDWLASLYDEETGGFYYAVSSRDYEGFAADIEDTAFVIDFLTDTGVMPVSRDAELPSRFRDRLITFLQSRQDRESGYFYDVQFGSQVCPSKRDRNLFQATKQLERFHETWLYPTPTERAASHAEEASCALPEEFQSEEKLLKWLHTLDFENSPYPAGHAVSSASPQLKELGLDAIVTEYLTKIQNPKTGMWGKALDYNSVNGAMKAAYIFSKAHPYPNIDRMFVSALPIIKSIIPRTTAEVWNPLSLFQVVLSQYGGKEGIPAETARQLDDSIAEIIDNAAENLKRFKQPDGGYSWSPQGSSITSQGVVVCLDLKEGDVNGTALASLTRIYAYLLAGVEMPLCYAPYRDDFFARVAHAKLPVKKPVER